ncbi:hypothetical protein M9H77_07112 [Catharanthus roseus]|uniref:Uncharacterized protein n=1 Tax=Catharanthus roseus TaxID=4058 RepID=A0ACC0BU01_CATRO|nr:hypothetical protein M9H77_07112 [Catharanthus roseus]
MACNCFDIWPCLIDSRHILHGVDFPSLLPRALAYFIGHTLVQKGGRQSDVRIDFYALDKIHNHTSFSIAFLIHTMHDTGYDNTNTIFTSFNVNFARERRSSIGPPHKTTQTGIWASSSQPTNNESENDESYELSAKDELSSVHLDAFQAEMWTTFDQFASLKISTRPSWRRTWSRLAEYKATKPLSIFQKGE